MIRHFIAAFALLLCLSHPALAKKDKVLDIQAVTTPAGVQAWIVEDKTAPVIAMSFSFEGGLAFDPEDKPGVGRLVSITLDEGAEKMKSQEFQSKLSDNAISMSFTAGRDAFYGNILTIRKNKDLAFDLLRAALNAPRFDQDAIDRMKNANTSEIKDNVGDPSWLVARTFNGKLFEGHYYARPGFGNLASMAAITRKDMLQFVKEQFARNVLKVAISGDITKDEAVKMIDDVFGKLPEKAGTVETPMAKLAYPGKTILLELDTPQTYIIAAEEGVARQDKDWHAAMIMNYILGGGSFSSRLMHEIREKRGLTYGVYSALGTMKSANLIQVNMSASNEKVEDALSLMKQEWAAMAKDGPTQQELEDAKSFLTGSLLLQLTSNNDIAAVMNDMQRDGLPPDYINKRNGYLRDVTIADVKRAGQRILKTDQLTTVLVGKPKNIAVDILLDKPPGMDEPPQ